MKAVRHRFEWGRARFRRWAEGVAARRGYTIRYADIGGAHPDLGGAQRLPSEGMPDGG